MDGFESVCVKPANLVPHDAPGDALAGLAIITGGNPWLLKAWWFDEAVEKSAATVKRFKALKLHLREMLPPLGSPQSRFPMQQILLDVPFIFDLGGGGQRKLPPTTYFVCNAMRLGISSLSVARLKLIIETADALNELKSAWAMREPWQVRSRRWASRSS